MLSKILTLCTSCAPSVLEEWSSTSCKQMPVYETYKDALLKWQSSYLKGGQHILGQLCWRSFTAFFLCAQSVTYTHTHLRARTHTRAYMHNWNIHAIFMQIRLSEQLNLITQKCDQIRCLHHAMAIHSHRIPARWMFTSGPTWHTARSWKICSALSITMCAFFFTRGTWWSFQGLSYIMFLH